MQINEGGVDNETDFLFSDAAVHERKFVAFKRTDREAFESAFHLLQPTIRGMSVYVKSPQRRIAQVLKMT